MSDGRGPAAELGGLPRDLHLGGGVELFPGGRRLDALLLEYPRVGPRSVGTVDLDRRGDPFAFVGGELLHGAGGDLGPVLLLGHRGEVAQGALLGPFADLPPEKLCGARWGPGVERRGLAAGGPPVQHLDALRRGGRGGAAECRRRQRSSRFRECRAVLPCIQCGSPPRAGPDVSSPKRHGICFFCDNEHEITKSSTDLVPPRGMRSREEKIRGDAGHRQADQRRPGAGAAARPRRPQPGKRRAGAGYHPLHRRGHRRWPDPRGAGAGRGGARRRARPPLGPAVGPAAARPTRMRAPPPSPRGPSGRGARHRGARPPVRGTRGQDGRRRRTRCTRRSRSRNGRRSPGAAGPAPGAGAGTPPPG